MNHTVMQFTGPKLMGNGKESAAHAQHAAALANRTNGFGHAIRKMLEGWEAYAEAHKHRYDDVIGNDYVIGEYWANTGLAIKRLLDGETGGWDCGSLAANITRIITENGLETDGYNLIGEDAE